MNNWITKKMLAETAISKIYYVVNSKQQEFALKVIKPEFYQFKDKIESAFKKFKKLDDQRVCKLHKLNVIGSEIHILMEYIEGRTLAQAEFATKLEKIEIAIELAKAISYLHQNQLLHLDLKPENILINGSTVKLIDFDLSLNIDDLIDKQDEYKGSVIYSSPEQCGTGRELTIQSDIYSYGLIVLEMFCGPLPYANRSLLEIAKLHVQGIEDVLSDTISRLPSELVEIVKRAISCKPTDRYLSISDIILSLNPLIEKPETTSDSENEVEDDYLPAFIDLHKQGETSRAIGELEVLLSSNEEDPFLILNTIILIQEEINSVELLKTYSRLGNLYLRTTDIRLAEEPFTKAVDLAKKHTNAEEILVANDDLAWLYLRLNEINKSQVLCREMIEFAEDQKLPYHKIKAKGMLANSYLESGDYQAGKAILLEQVEVYRELGDMKGMTTSLLNIGLCERNSGKLISAEKYYIEVLKLAIEHKLPAAEAVCYSSLGITYNIQGEYDKSITYLEKKIEMEKASNNLPGLSIGYSSIANSYNAKADYAQALEYYRLQFEVNKKQNNIAQMIACYFNQATVYFKLNQFDVAETYLNRAIKDSEEQGMEKRKLFYLTLRASIWQSVEKYDDALKLTKELIEAGKSMELEDVLYEASLTYARTAFNLKDNAEIKHRALLNIMQQLETTEHETFKLEYNRCIFQLTGSEFHREQAMKLLKKFNLESPSPLWQNSIRELEIEKSAQLDSEMLIRSLVKLMTPESANEELLKYLTMASNADNCRIVTYNRELGVVENSIFSSDLEEEDIDFSSGIIMESVQDLKPILIRNAVDLDRFKTNQSILGKAFLSVITVPLLLSKSIVGALYLDRRNISKGVFSNADEQRVEQIGEILLPILRGFISRNMNNQRIVIQEKSGFVGNSKQMQKLYSAIISSAKADSPVIITGESGTGKEVTAQALHSFSNRSKGPFISINCAAIPEHLAEGELFGHKKGAYTGAMNDRKGKFELAQGGTLFLDEIGELPLQLQSKLLRAIENNEITPLGSERTINVNVRIISATNRNLENEVAEKKFRNDLFYRLNVFQIELPPLRAHKDDIPSLAEHFLNGFANQYKRVNYGFSQSAIDYLLSLNYKQNNIRELRNLIEKAFVNNDDSYPLTASNLQGKETNADLISLKNDELQFPDVDNLDEALAYFEVKIIKKTLVENNWNKSQTAKILKISRPRIDRVIKKHDLSK